jgi:hypothetical protein
MTGQSSQFLKSIEFMILGDLVRNATYRGNEGIEARNCPIILIIMPTLLRSCVRVE